MPEQILVADHSRFVRSLLCELVEHQHEVVGTAENGVELVDRYHQAEPTVVLTEIEMPIRDGLDATAEIVEDDDTAVVVCTSEDDQESIDAAFDAGAVAYVTKPFQKAAVLAAIDDAASA